MEKLGRHLTEQVPEEPEGLFFSPSELETENAQKPFASAENDTEPHVRYI